MRKTRLAYAYAALVVAACGGSSAQTPVNEPGGEHATAPPQTVSAPDVAGEPATRPPPPVPEEPTGQQPPPPPPGTTIELKNEADSDIMFSTTKGWQPVIFAYTGKPPKAKSVMLFAGACTASCDEAETCPSCPQPKNKKEELAMAKSETAAAGGSVRVPWDGKIFAYEKAPKKHCKCWKKIDPPADTYTIKACGLRPSKEPGKPSKPVCTETQATLGGSLPSTITLSFAK
jgi:hypothetical protein